MLDPRHGPLDIRKLPDVRPDRRRFHLLRLLTATLLVAGLVASVYGVMLAALAYYGTKNGSELARLVGSVGHGLAFGVGGFFAMAIGQLFRVVLAIEENTRLIAFHTRPRPRAEPAATRHVPAAGSLKDTNSKA